MNSLNCCLLLTSSVLVILLIDTTTAFQDGCVFECLKAVIKCNRQQRIPGMLPKGTDCCAIYTDCYMECHPNASKGPSCKRSKRGSWNKRVPPMFAAMDDTFEPQPEFQLRSHPGKQYYRDALNYLFRPTGDDLE